jgi:hypothetical protein
MFCVAVICLTKAIPEYLQALAINQWLMEHSGAPSIRDANPFCGESWPVGLLGRALLDTTPTKLQSYISRSR